MGTASFSVGKSRPNGTKASSLRTSGAFTTSITAANLEDGSGDINLSAGELIRIHADEAMRVSFGGTATASTGHYIPAGGIIEIECTDPGLVSIIDVA